MMGAFKDDGKMMRESEAYGDVRLSVQASDIHYSTPRVRGLPLDHYTHVEVAVIGPTERLLRGPSELFGRPIKTSLCRPSQVGIVGFDHLFEDGDGPVAGYIPQAEVERLREALRTRMEAVNREAD